MVIYDRWDIVFQEVPDEISLSFSIKGCKIHCEGCHSPHLWEEDGNELTIDLLISLLKKYKNAITCVLFLGGDNCTDDIINLCKIVQRYGLKTAMYSGWDIPLRKLIKVLDYYKIGHYDQRVGGLSSSKTNQKFYKIDNEKMINITNKFWK